MLATLNAAPICIVMRHTVPVMAANWMRERIEHPGAVRRNRCEAGVWMLQRSEGGRVRKGGVARR